MIKCKRIPHNATIGIYSPSEPITESRESRFEKGLSVIRENGFKIKLGRRVLEKHFYMAGTPRQRAEDIMELIRDDEVDLLLASWGGKSCNQILSLLDYDVIKNVRKPILGFSDSCVLLNAITEKTGLFTIHGPNVAGKFFETSHADLAILTQRSFKENLLGSKKTPENAKAIRGGSCVGRLFGGNLSTFTLGLLGSDFFPSYAQGIFFWESAGETPQIIDQHLTCLRNAGIFENVKGMVIGDFIREETEDYKRRDPFEVILSVLGDYSFPILYCPSFGHPSHLENPPIPIGPLCELDTDKATLILDEDIVE